MNDLSDPQVPHVTPEEVKLAIDSHEVVKIIDVRTPGEFSRGKIEGSVNIPLDTLTADIEKIIPDKQQKLFVYCLSGSRSIHAVGLLLSLGYTQVFDMSHGLLAWRVKGYPMV